jgi:phosphoserine phosphatase
VSLRGAAIVAVVFDFDDTLIGDSTTLLLAKHGIKPTAFWRQVKKLVAAGYEPTLAWLTLFLENVGPDKPLGALANADLRAFGRELDGQYAPGLPELFDDLRDIVSAYRDIQIEFYVLSGGLQDVIQGSRVVESNMTDTWGCLLAEDKATRMVASIKRSISFTEKTRYLFQINKGLSSKETFGNPYLVNKHVAPEDRRVRFEDMIYVGDGLTDIPCFSLVRNRRGMTFGVFDPTEKDSARRALLELLQPGRVASMHAAKYGRGDELGEILRAAVATRCAAITLERERA